MTSPTDPATNEALPANSIQRILFLAPRVHVFQVPPLTSSTKGYSAAQWTAREPIFTARLRVFETAVPRSPAPPASSGRSGADAGGEELVTVSIRLEDASSGELFAAAPYAHPSAVQQCQDSSRFFAVRVEGPGPGGKKVKATLGVGFEERSEAFDFGVALADAGKVLGFGQQDGGAGRDGRRKGDAERADVEERKKDYSIKEGESIVVNIGGKGRRVKTEEPRGGSGAAFPILPPPPSAEDVKREMRADAGHQSSIAAGTRTTNAQELGFDDDFGDFQ